MKSSDKMVVIIFDLVLSKFGEKSKSGPTLYVITYLLTFSQITRSNMSVILIILIEVYALFLKLLAHCRFEHHKTNLILNLDKLTTLYNYTTDW